MKNIRLITTLMSLAGAVCLTGCEDDEQQEAAEVRVSTETITLSAVDGSQKIIVKSNTAWTLTCSADWLEAEPQSGNGDTEVVLSASDNVTSDGADTQGRTTSVSVLSGDGLSSTTVAVTQKGYSNTTLDISPSSLSFASGGGGQTLTVTSNASWSVKSSGDWLTVSPTSGSGDGTVTVTAEDNEGESTTADRTATLVFTTDDGLIESVGVSQDGLFIATLTLSAESLSFDGTSAESQTLTVTSNTDWTVTASDSWVSVSPGSGSSNGIVTVSVADNDTDSEREGTLLFATSDNSVEVSIPVAQALAFVPELSIDVTQFNFASSGSGSQTLTITSNTAWTITADSWITFSQTTGKGNAEVSVSVADNVSSTENTFARIGSIGVEDDSQTIALSSSVYQQGKMFVADETYFSDDFEWMAAYAEASGAGDNVATGYSSTTAPNIYTSISDLATELSDKGYEMISSSSGIANTYYLQSNYLKFAKSAVQAGIILPEITLPSSTDIVFTFNWCPMRGGTYSYDKVSIEVLIGDTTVATYSHSLVDGGDGSSTGGPLEWQTVRIETNTDNIPEGKITIRSSQWGVSGYYRWFLDNINIYKKQ